MSEITLVFTLAILVIVVSLVRRARRSASRLAWLGHQHLLLNLSAFRENCDGFVAVVVIDFGAGTEVWVTQNEDLKNLQNLLDDQKRIVANGFRLYPNPTKSALVGLCQDFGLRKLEIHTI